MFVTQGVFCFGCGRPGVSKPRCLRCNPKNLPTVASNLGVATNIDFKSRNVYSPRQGKRKEHSVYRHCYSRPKPQVDYFESISVVNEPKLNSDKLSNTASDEWNSWLEKVKNLYKHSIPNICSVSSVLFKNPFDNRP